MCVMVHVTAITTKITEISHENVFPVKKPALNEPSVSLGVA